MYDITAYDSRVGHRIVLFTWTRSAEGGVHQAKLTAKDFGIDEYLSDYKAEAKQVLEFVDVSNQFRSAFVVMQNGKCLAKATPIVGWGLWRLWIEGASWTDPRARQPVPRKDGQPYPSDYKTIVDKIPHIMYVKSKREARKIMQELANQGVPMKARP